MSLPIFWLNFNEKKYGEEEIMFAHFSPSLVRLQTYTGGWFASFCHETVRNVGQAKFLVLSQILNLTIIQNCIK